MKANAPEKIYLYPSQLKKGKILGRWFMTRYNQDSVEYIRADVFIEKACEFFEEYIKEEDCKFGSSEWTELRAEYESLDSFIRAFKNYIKGE